MAVVMPIFGQDNKAKTDMKKNDMSDMAAKPTFEATTGGLHLKVWVMAKGEGMKDNDMMAGTHHIMVAVTDAESGKEVTDANVKILSLSPTNKSASVDLKTMMNQFGGNLSLDEKGEYELTVSVDVNGVANSTPFKYTVL
jgi:hypothetical protein